MRSPRRSVIVSILWAVGLVLLSWPGPAAADDELKIAGFVAGLGGPLNLPVAFPVTIQIQLGIPMVQIPVLITPSTAVKSETGQQVLTNGDRVKIEAVIAGGAINATELKLEAFPEIEVTGTASGLPPAGISLPLAPNALPVTFQLTLVPGVTLTVVLNGNTKVEDEPLTLTNGAVVEIEAAVRNMMLVVTEISAGENEGENEGEND
jgi:hypothetical protein